jgi:hypothetical protein
MAIYINRDAPESGIASLLALQGNRGDTELVHMTKPEVNMLRDTGKMSMNTQTGLPQFSNGSNVFTSILPTILSMLPESSITQSLQQGGLIGLAAGGIPSFDGHLFRSASMPDIPLKRGGSVPFEGQIPGEGHGMQDNVHMPIMNEGGIAAVSPDEYVVPADVMAMIGNGSADAGAGAMDDFIAKFRTVKYGRPEQPPEINPGSALQSLIG